MEKEIFKKRQYYFGFLFSSFVYIGLLIIIQKKTLPLNFGFYQQIFSFIGATIPALLFFLKKAGIDKNLRGYIYLLATGHIPLIIGFFLSIIFKNMLYILLMFPVFILGYLILIPVNRRK